MIFVYTNNCVNRGTKTNRNITYTALRTLKTIYSLLNHYQQLVHTNDKHDILQHQHLFLLLQQAHCLQQGLFLQRLLRLHGSLHFSHLNNDAVIFKPKNQKSGLGTGFYWFSLNQDKRKAGLITLNINDL